MSSIDNRVVKLVFDNSQFERNASSSLRTIEKLKESLNFKGSVKGLDNLQSEIEQTRFDSILSGLEAIESRFSPLGIAGMTVFNELTKAALNFVTSTASAIGDSIFGGGQRRAFALENARFTLQGLTKDASEVEEVMKNALNSVKGTAYGYGDAASAAAQLFASGIESGEAMETVLSGISGVAATTNSQYSEIAHIFTTIAGNGRLMTEQLNQFSYRGMNAAATLTDAFNQVLNGSSTLSVELQDHIRAAVEFGMNEVKDFGGSLEGITEGDLRTLVTKGAIQFDMFSAIMANTFGEHAFDANKTFTGSMENIQAALSRTGAMFYTGLIAQEGPIVKMFNSVMDAVDAFNAQLTPLADVWTNSVNWMANTARTIIDTFTKTGGFEAVGKVIKYVADSVDWMGSIFKSVFIGSGTNTVAVWVSTLVENLKDLTSGLDANNLAWDKFKVFAEIIKNVLSGLGNILMTIFGIFKSIFAALSETLAKDTWLDTILGMSDGFKNLTEAIKPSSEEISKLSNCLSGILSIASTLAKILINTLGGAFKFLGDLFGIFIPKSFSLYDALSFIGDILKIVSNYINKFYDILSSHISLSPIIDFLTKLREKFDSLIDIRVVTDSISNFVSAIRSQSDAGEFPIFDRLSELFSVLKEKASKLSPIITKSFEGISQAFGFLKDRLSEITPGLSINFDEIAKKAKDSAADINRSFKEGNFPFLEKLGKVLESIRNKLKEVAPIIKNKIDEIRGSLANLTTSFKDGATKYDGLDLIGLLGIGGAAIMLKKIVDFIKKIKSGGKDVGTIKDGLLEIKDAVVDTFGQIQTTLKVGSIVAIAAAIGIFAASLTAISKIPSKNLLGSMAAISVFMLELRGIMNEFTDLGKVDIGSMIATGFSLVLFTYSVKKLADAVSSVGEMPMKSIIQGVAVVSLLVAEMIGVAKILATDKGEMVKAGGTLIGMALAILILVAPLKLLADIDSDKIQQGLFAVGTLIAALSTFSALVGMSDFNAGMGLGIVEMALAILLLYKAVEMFGTMDISVLQQGGLVILAILASFAATAAVAGSTNFGAGTGFGIMEMAAALYLLYFAIQMFAGIDQDAFAEGMMKIAISLAAVVAAAMLVGGTEFGISAGAGLSAIGLGLLLIAGALAILSSISLPVLAGSLIILFVALAGTALIASALAPTVPVILAFAAALGALGLVLTVIALAIGGMVIAMGLFGTAMIGMLETASSLVEPMIQAFTDFINSLADAIRNNQDSLLDAIGSLLLALGEMILNAFLKIGEWFANDVWPWIQENGPGIVQGFIDGICGLAGDLWAAATELWNGFIDEVAKGIEEMIKGGGEFVEGFIEGVFDFFSDLGEAAGELWEEFVDGVGEGIDNIIQAGADFVGGFIEGLLGGLDDVWQAACDLATQAWNAMTGTLDEHSPSKLTYGGGENFTLGFINGMLSLKDSVSDKSKDIALSALNAFDPINDVEYNYTPTITPVVDLSNIQNGINTMDSMFDKVPSTYGISGQIDARTDLNQQVMLALGEGSDYSDIIDTMIGLRNDLARYSETMTKLKVVMDSGTLVGELTPGIDRQLGRNAMMAGRRI